ncbi:putative serine/threonine-protein kinase YPL150W [Siniperca chuatsi]|uniref:putative serine/threonine-protein kinase YPL150W n=1 Tax=Siniperca chuatsi TaxID=119488 RepID=UPI001CE1AA75|nr:putative serine/threonine-protein kinase YPL150W [Siniperca chuatsi]XP_044039761.1 putative serine/threonine-protein kinase YPL150W [Siniperca chuatsi]
MERYESLGLVGEGSYGSVLKCRHRDSGRLVAIKKFVDSDNDKTVKKIALREIKLLRQLRHDNLVNLLEAWKRRRRWYLVFEFVERTLLDDLEQNPSGLDLDTSRQYLYQILRAAAFCHQQNIIHRDIKPENILISQGGVVKLCDFGFARIMASPAEGGVYTDYVATRWYRAPELLVGDTKYSKPVDVWAVGCLLIEMLTGQPLFPGDSDLDQIYHIVRCFGNLTAHHQELFYRNPVFSGVRLPEYSGRVRLEQRFPAITPTALDLAQSCLQMDPERRAQCSELLEHPLFAQDSFHIRVLDELNAKIQKDHRENSTLPKIVKTPRREKDEGDEKNRRGKDKKQPEDVNEKVSKEKVRKGEEKMEKTKGKQPSKPSKTIRNTSELLMATKQSKTLGAKIIDNAAKTNAAVKSKLGKSTGAGLRKQLEISRPTKTVTSDFSEGTKTAIDLKNNYTVVAKPKYGKVASPEPSQDHLKTTKNTKDRDSSGLRSSCSDNIVSSVIEKSVMEIKKVPKLSESSTTDHPNGSSSPESTTDRTDTQSTPKMGKISTPEYPEDASTVVTSKISKGDQVETSFTLKPSSQPSRNDPIEVATPTVPSVTKPCKKTTSKHQTDPSTTDTEQRRTSECPKVLLSNSNPAKTTSNCGPKMTRNNTSLSTSPSKNLTTQSSTVFIEASPAHSTTTLPKGTSNSKLFKTDPSSDTKPTNYPTCAPNKASRGLPADRELTEVLITTRNQQDSCSNTSNKDINEDHGCLKMSPPTKTAANHIEISNASGGDYKEYPESSEPSTVHQQSTSKSKITTESRTTSTPNEIPKTTTSVGTNIPKTLKVSDKENRKDLALCVSISATTNSLVNEISKVSGSSNIEQKNSSSEAEPNTKSLKPPHSKSLIGEPKTKLGSFNNHAKSTATVTLKSQKTTFSTEARKKRDNPERNDINISTNSDSTSFTSSATADHRSSIFHNVDAADVNEFDFSVSHSSPPSSTPLIPSFTVVSTNSPAASDHLSLGAGFHPGTHSLRCVDKTRLHGGSYSRLAQQSLSSHITRSLTAQASEKSLICEHSFLSDRCNLGKNITAAKKKSDIHFPDLRSSVLPELRGRAGKHNKGTSKDQRKDKQSHPSTNPPSEPQQHKHHN